MAKSDREKERSRSRRRRFWLALCLLPAVGCGPSWGLRSKWGLSKSGDPVAQESEVIAATAPEPLVHSAAFRQATPGEFRGAKTALPQLPAGAPDALKLPETDPSIDQEIPTLPEAIGFESPQQPSPTVESLPAPEIDHGMAIDASSQVIDLGSALGMAGGNAWVVQLARQRTVEAHAELQRARALWLPTLQLGVGWNKHDGRIQATNGEVIEASRSSLFVGGGATYGAPVAGGSGGPFRLFADLALADAFFEPKIASRALSAQRAGVSVAKNEALRDAGIAYVDLVEAAGQLADAQAAISAAAELLELTRMFEKAGAGAKADVDRAATEQARLSQLSLDAERKRRVRSATLARRLRLDPRFTLEPADQVVVPLDLAGDTDLDSQIAMALSRRPEIIEQSHRIAGLCLAVKKAQMEPWLPSVTMATSGGNFGGGRGTSLDNKGSRSDIDLQAIWELDSMGLGVAANRCRAGSQLAQQRIELADLRDEITAEVVRAHENVMNYRSQIESAEAALGLAEASYERNLLRVKAGEGLPIELLQAINARAEGLRDRTAAVSRYNRAQLNLLFATGQLRP